MDDKQKASGIQIGYKGVKYGLQKPPTKRPAAFDDSSEDEGVDVRVAREQQRNLTATKVTAAREKALAEDSTVYEYDAVYDDMQKQRADPKKKDIKERKPKYIQQLVQKAEIRKKEQDLAYERRMLKERKRDDHLYEHKGAYITTAYKKKLTEDRFWIEREKRLDAEEAAEDVTKQTDLSGFYGNLMNKNISFASNRLADDPIEQPLPSTLPTNIPSAQPPLSQIPETDKTATPTKLEEIQETEDKEVEPQETKSDIPESVEAAQGTVRHAVTVMELTEKAPLVDRRCRRHDADSISSARARYLERKRRRTETQPL